MLKQFYRIPSPIADVKPTMALRMESLNVTMASLGGGIEPLWRFQKERGGPMVLGCLVRKLLYMLLGLVALAVLALIGLEALLERAVEGGIETVGAFITKVPLEVENVNMSVLKRSFALDGLEMGNPEGFQSKRSVYVGQMAVSAQLRSLLSEEVVLEQIEVDSPELTLEFSGRQTNLGEILEGMRKPDEKDEPTTKKLRINTLHIRRPRVQVAGLPGGQSIPLPLPDITLRDLTAGGEARTPRQIALQILEAVYREILDAAEGKLPAEQLDRLKDMAIEKGKEALDKGVEELKRRLDQLLK